jgi:hypothetical protein
MKVHLQERLGVPNNLIDTANRFYFDLIEEVSREVKASNRKEDYYFYIKPEPPYTLGEYQITSMKVNMKIIPNENSTKVEFISMSVTSVLGKPKEYLHKGKITFNIKSPVYSITIVAPENFTREDIINYFTENKKELLPPIAHEFKHIYDEEKKEYEVYSDRSQYIAGRELMDIDLEELKLLGYYIYFTHGIEALVRPSEILAYLTENKISKKEFLNFLNDNKTYETLKDINKFSVNEMRETLKKNHMDEVNKYLEKNSSRYRKEFSDDKKLDLLFAEWYMKYVETDATFYQNLITDGPFESLFGLPENKLKALQRHVDRLGRFAKKPLEYFDYIENYLKVISGETLKKIAKLYDFLEDEENEETTLQKKISSRSKR